MSAWAAEKVERGPGFSPPRVFTPAERSYSADAADVWELSLAQRADEGGTWVTEVRCLVSAAEASAACLTIAMRVEPDSGDVAPVRYYVDPPRFLRLLADGLAVRVGRSEATIVPRSVESAADVQKLVDELRSADRALPLIVVTSPAHGPSPIPDLAKRLASHLFALATVVELARPATFELSDAIGKEMSVFDGGLRLYWPKWSVDDPLEKHPLFLRRRLEIAAWQDPRHPDRLVRSSLVSRLTRAAAARFAYPQPMLAAITASSAKAIKDGLADATAPDLVKQVQDLSAKVTEHRELEELAVSENTQLREDVERFRKELSAARKENERLRGALAAAKGEAEGQVEISPWEIEDPHDAIERARSDFADTLVFPDGLVVKTSQPGGWWYHALQSLHQLCEADRAGEAANKRATLQQLLAQNGLQPKDTYKAGDTAVYVTDPASAKSFECRERVHLVEGKPAETESIYWVSLGEPQSARRFLIARLGRHA